MTRVKEWDAIVIGAGPAGSMAAREIARRGKSVLLLDKAKFPRSKVCGCCLNAGAMATLERVGLGGVPARVGAREVEAVQLISERGKRSRLRLRGGVSVSRRALDEALVSAAVAAGVEFESECAAVVGPVEGEWRTVRLGRDAFRAKCVIAADGLAGTSLREVPGFEPVIASRTRVGVSCELDAGPFERGAITMVCGKRGYVGAVWLEDGRLDVAAAVNAAWMKEVGGPGAAVRHIYEEAGLCVPGLEEAEWRGTPGLTRSRRVAGEGLLVIGDAAGYVEPFTGEGMAWAIASGSAAGKLVGAGQQANWARVHRALVGRRQRECRWIARLLRHSTLSSLAIAALGSVPGLAAPIVRRISAGRSTLEMNPS